ncbi:MAG: hypothetical protein QOF03_176 [Alphaproteobacteria bacterium]|jgi:hypothetical protein|nr:hypothetical protein [Alphaproteobacteria bacterium]
MFAVGCDRAGLMRLESRPLVYIFRISRVIRAAPVCRRHN